MPLTSTQNSFNGGRDSVYQSLYPDLSGLVGGLEERQPWDSSVWVNLLRSELPGEEESRIWGTKTDEYPSPEPVRPNFHPHLEAPNSSAPPTEADSFVSYSTDSDEYDDFDIGGGGVTLDCFEELKVEEVRVAEAVEIAEIAEVTVAKLAVPESSAQEPGAEVASSAISTADTEEDYDGGDDLEILLQGT